MKSHLNKSINIDYSGSRIRIPSEAEIIEGWYSCLEFFEQREAWHTSAADWYFKQSHITERKASDQLALAEVARVNHSHYLELIGAAICNGFSFHKKSEVNHAG